MDIFLPIALFIIFFVMFSICGWCCKRHREGTVYGQNQIPVSVASQHVSASPVVVPPYPMGPNHPVPQNTQYQPPAPGFAPPPMGYQSGNYPPTSAAPGFYPPPMGIMGQGYPPATGGYPPADSYPPAGGYPPQPAPPPSYTEAVRLPPMSTPQSELYAKQAPYNPNY